MDPMFAAIKKRKGSGLMGDHTASHMPEHAMDKDDDQSKLHDLVASLSESEKHQLKSLLDDKQTEGIAKGDPSSEEKAKIAQMAQSENEMNDMEDETLPEDESDEVAMSMLDHKSMNASPETQPRNLGERMRMMLASKLKSKGKI